MEVFQESIPSEVWDFVKRNTSNIVKAGILALIIWRFIKKNKKKESFEEASFSIKPFLDIANDLNSINDVTNWVKKNNLDKEGHCQNIAALYAYVDGSTKGITTKGHIAFIKNDKVYDLLRFNKVPVDVKEWKAKYPDYEIKTLIPLKTRESYSERLNKLLETKLLNIGTKVSFIDSNGEKQVGKIKYYNKNQSGDYSVDVNGSIYHNIQITKVKEI
jgi:hypothetical protein